MPTVVRTIGSGGGRDYSTLAAWAASLPSNLVASGNSYEGQCYNDSEFAGSTTLLALSGHTTDASHTITLTTAAGQSFRDNAGIQSNALNYNPSNGVGITSNVSAATIICTDSNVTFSNLQIKNTDIYGRAFNSEGPATAVRVDDCILVVTAANYVVATSGNQKIRNSLLLNRRSGAAGIVSGSLGAGIGSAALYFCTLVVPSDVTAASQAINALYGSATAENCAFFGCTTVKTGSTSWTFTSCMTDVASPPSGVTGGKTYSHQFQNTTASSGDFREKPGADLRGSGTADSANGATDIAGIARPQGGNWDIGCWELLASSTIVTRVAQMPIELLPVQRAAPLLHIESIAMQRVEFGMPPEHLATQRIAAQTPFELAALLCCDRSMPVVFDGGVTSDLAGSIEGLSQAVADRRIASEWLSQAVADRRIASEWLSRLLGDMEAPDEFTAALAGSSPVSHEWLGAVATLLSADEVLPIEWSAQPASVLVSLERLLASPGKRRILGTTGRLRLLKRL